MRGASVVRAHERGGTRARYHVGMQQERALVAVRGRATLILDTTYCAAQYNFPPQLQVPAQTPGLPSICCRSGIDLCCNARPGLPFALFSS